LETRGRDRWLNISESSMKEIVRVPIYFTGEQLYIVICEHEIFRSPALLLLIRASLGVKEIAALGPSSIRRKYGGDIRNSLARGVKFF
jgi:hypothetical protein